MARCTGRAIKELGMAEDRMEKDMMPQLPREGDDHDPSEKHAIGVVIEDSVADAFGDDVDDG